MDLRRGSNIYEKQAEKKGRIDVLILCGGQGTRLRSVVSDKPKVLAEVGGRPFLDILLERLMAQGLNRFVLGSGHLGGQMKEYAAEKKGCTIECSEEEKPLGTGGAIKKAKELLVTDDFLVVNGDCFYPINISDFQSHHQVKGGLVSLALAHMEDTHDYGTVELDQNHRITRFREKENTMGRGLVNAGMYIMNKEIFSHMPHEDRFSLEYDVFPKLTDGRCVGFIGEGEFIDIGIPERYQRAAEFFNL